ncbi:arsenic transporter [Lederbergia wuyishanensis]|uniref:Arsenical pump membrane protein n=1 Tax=Lederbergia wuyishanensis TaxID=1347903 RepID=A0ABU0D081_9BACI|nr:arsenic transporter [Lederbergia wuyishanensis]MCJ8006419.1 arsenic transporter [Lederbergia wuyishanensis]MDQ0341794.1 arsenical pump membrane protein [Lederbergia wuyishanensis]
MLETSFTIMLVVFTLTIILMLWRPLGINETIPTTIGAAIVLYTGIVSWDDVIGILLIVNGPALTILSTIMMTIVLDSIGFFRWIALNIVNNSKGSGIRLYLFTNLLCFFMTMLFNNDGSILITTPIIIYIVKILKLKPHQILPYLISGALIATAASAPIAVSNISNLIALKIVGLSLNSYVQMMFIPSMLGILTIAVLMFHYFKNNIPKKINTIQLKLDPHNMQYKYSHPLEIKSDNTIIDWKLFKISLIIVVATRASFFVLSPLGIATEWVGLIGAATLVLLRWIKTGTGIFDIVKKTPWHILLFAFNMYVLVYGLKNIGLNDFIVLSIKGFVELDPLNATFVMGLLSTSFSNLFNNLPAVMISTLTIIDMDLDPLLLQVAYLANVIGSDIGALLTPIGTLATLIWMFILKKNSINISWGQYLKITLFVIPIGLIVSLLSLYLWVIWLFD